MSPSQGLLEKLEGAGLKIGVTADERLLYHVSSGGDVRIRFGRRLPPEKIDWLEFDARRKVDIRLTKPVIPRDLWPQSCRSLVPQLVADGYGQWTPDDSFSECILIEVNPLSQSDLNVERRQNLQQQLAQSDNSAASHRVIDQTKYQVRIYLLVLLSTLCKS